MIWDLQLLNYRENRVFVFGVAGFLLIYVFSSIGMWDPEGIEVLQDMMDLLPPAMTNMLGFDNLGGSLTSYLLNYMYGFLMLLFPIIYTIMVGNRLVSKHATSGSMIFLLTMPYSRRRIMINQAIFYASGLLFIFLVNVTVMILFSNIMFPGMLDIGKLLIINLVTYGAHLILAGVTFLFSCYFDDSQTSVMCSSIVLIGSTVAYMVSNLGDGTAFLKYVSVFTFIDVDYILEGSGNGLLIGLLLTLIGAGSFVAGIELFDRKSIVI